MSLSRTPLRNARQQAHKPTDPTTIAIYALVGAGLFVMGLIVWIDVFKVVAR